MTSLAEPAAGAAPEVSKMSKVQKLAALLIILGPDGAAQILRSLGAQNLDAVATDMARLPVITQDLRTDILREMSEVAMVATTTVRGGVEYTQAALEKAVGSHKASDIISRVSPNRGASALLQTLQEMEPRHIFNLMKEEHIQTITLVTSYLRSEKASALLGLLRPDLRGQVI